MKIAKNTLHILDTLPFENWNKADVKKVRVFVKENIDSQIQEFKNLRDEDLSFENLFRRSDLYSAKMSNQIYPLHIFELVHSDKEIRELSRNEVVEISNMLTEFSYNEDIFNKIKTYFQKKYKKEKSKLTSEEVKIVEDTIRSYKKMGMFLDKDKRKKLVELNNKIDKISSDFSLECTKTYEEGLWFTKEELDGVPEAILSSLKYDDDKKKYFVSAFLRSQYRNIQTFAKNYKTRFAITKRYEEGSKGKNLNRLASVLKLRNEITKILGFKTFAHMAQTEQMVNTPEKVDRFLTDLAKNTKQKMSKEFKLATQILKAEKLSLNTSNLLYSENLAKAQNVNLDVNELAKYFEFENTINAMFKIWEDFYGVVNKPRKEMKVFGEGVKCYDFFDKETGTPLGTAIFDLVPRDGKYGHACVSSLKTRFVNEEGNVETATGILICNFIKNKNGKTLLNMESVSTLFHEGGHLLHKLLGKNNYSSTGPFSTSIDFVEIHSQFNEYFAGSKVAVDLVAKHFETGEKIPKDLKDKIESADEYFGAFFWMRQTVQSLFDQEIHGKNILKYAKNPESINKLFLNLYKKYIGIETTGKRFNFASTFNHMVGGYQARYYGYTVSRAYAQDSWEHFVSKGLKAGSKVVKDYKNVLEAGNMVREDILVKKYLGRNPSVKAFVKHLNK
jgi:Zn-dependent oligopeptidase